MKIRIRKFLRRFFTEAYRLKLEEKRLEKEFQKQLRTAKAARNEEEIGFLKAEYNTDSFINWEQREALLTKSLIKEAEGLRVHIPAKPNWTVDGYEESEDWDGIYERYLTDKGISKLEEEIEKKKKWKRERWAFVIQCTSAAVTVIGTLSGWIAFYL
jgi:hypothetical protein